MGKVHETVKLKAEAADVWRLIGGFGALSDWHPAAVATTTEVRGGDTIRTITIPGGGKLIEKLEAHDDDAMSMTYTILESPLPVGEYHSTLKVVADGEDACTVDWSGTFNPVAMSDAEAEKVVRGIYTAGLGALLKKFGS